MKKRFLSRSLLFLFLSFNISLSFAWNHSIDFGYGRSHDPNDTKYTNSGYLLSGDLIALKRTSLTFWSINGAIGQWHSTAPTYKFLTTAALSLALRWYPLEITNNHPYFLASVGPSFLSSKHFSTNNQAGHLTIQTLLGLGNEYKNFDLNLRLVHYSNANLAKPNEGYNILYLLSVGYLFE
jgi:hypothetical protein